MWLAGVGNSEQDRVPWSDQVLDNREEEREGGPQLAGCATVTRLHKEFRNSRESLENDPRVGRPSKRPLKTLLIVWRQ